MQLTKQEHFSLIYAQVYVPYFEKIYLKTQHTYEIVQYKFVSQYVANDKISSVHKALTVCRILKWMDTTVTIFKKINLKYLIESLNVQLY